MAASIVTSGLSDSVWSIFLTLTRSLMVKLAYTRRLLNGHLIGGWKA
jgi:hypothetical protein